MSYDQQIARRVRKSMAGRGRIREVQAFGGIMFMLDDKMCVGVSEDRLMVRVNPAKHETLVAKPGAEPMDFTGRPMRGFLYVSPQALPDSKALGAWVNESVAYVRTVEKKPKRAAATPGARGPRAPQGSRRKRSRS